VAAPRGLVFGPRPACRPQLQGGRWVRDRPNIRVNSATTSIPGATRHSEPALYVPADMPFDNGSLNLAADGRVQEYE
jgi:hypothetical protein